jgi:hypothetical protein
MVSMRRLPRLLVAVVVSLSSASAFAQATAAWEFDGFTEPEVHPMTGLLTFGSRLADYAPYPEPILVDRLIAFERVAGLVDDPLATTRGVAFTCSERGAANGTLVTITSPHIPSFETVYLVLFDQGVEIGSVAAEWFTDGEGAPEAFVVLDDDEDGLLKALLLYGDLDALILDDYEDVVDAWRISARGLATAVTGLGCR